MKDDMDKLDLELGPLKLWHESERDRLAHMQVYCLYVICTRIDMYACIHFTLAIKLAV